MRRPEAAGRIESATRRRSADVQVYSTVGGFTIGIERDDTAVVGLACRGPDGVAVIGSGARGLAPTPDEAAERVLAAFQSGSRHPLSSAGDDVASIGVVAEKLIVATGRGVHRVAIHESDNGIVVSSQIELVARALGGELDVERDHEDFLLSYAFYPDHATAFRNVHFVPGGTTRMFPSEPVMQTAPTGADETTRSLPSERSTLRTALHELLLEIVADQAATQAEHAVFLGGVDSALVASLLSQLGYEVRTFTFAFEDAKYNQQNVAQLVSHIGAEHTWVPITAEVIGAGLREFATVYNQPVAQPHYLLHTLTASREIRKHGLAHAFSGDGADAALLGYPSVNQRAAIIGRTLAVPPILRSFLRRLLGIPPIERKLGHAGRKARGVLEHSLASGPAMGHLPTPILDGVATRQLRCDEPPQAETVASARARLAEPYKELAPAQLALQGHALIGQSKTKIEGATADSGLAMSSPFLDPRLKAFAAAIPPEHLRAPGSAADSLGKELFLEMAEQDAALPRQVVRQPKQAPVSSPIDDWYSGSLRSTVIEMLQGLPFDYDESYVESLLAHHRADSWFRQRFGIGDHIFHAIGLLCSYAAFSRLASDRVQGDWH